MLTTSKIFSLRLAKFLPLALGISCAVEVSAQTELLPPGFRPLPAGEHALIHARVIPRPGELVTNAVILIRDGRIEKFGTNVAVPAESRVWDMQGMTVYAGFIDPYLCLETDATPKNEDDGGSDDGLHDDLRAGVNFYGVGKGPAKSSGPVYEVGRVNPERRIADFYQPDDKALEKMREIGFTAANVVPGKGIFRGSGAFVNLSTEEPSRVILKPEVFQSVALDNHRGGGDAYPSSLMGVIAVVRQSFLDADYYAKAHEWAKSHPGEGKRPEYNKSLEALSRAVAEKTTFAFEPMDALMVSRSAIIAREMGINICIVSSGDEWRRPDLAKATGASFIVPLHFPELPKMPSEDDWQQVRLDQFRAWDWAPENAAVLQNEGLQIALTTQGLDDKKSFRKNLEKALDRGLTESNALAAITTVPAKLCGMEADLGTIAPGKLANLTVIDGTNYFNPENKVKAVWIEGRNYSFVADKPEKPEAKGGDTNKVEKLAKKDDDSKADSKKDESVDKKKDSADDKKPLEKEKAEKLAKKKALEKRVAKNPLEGRGVLASPSTLIITNATLWTSGKDGIIEHGNLWVESGKIKFVGASLPEAIPTGTNFLVIDGTGLSVTPGIVDCHSHSMILGGVNEGTLPSSAMVRIGDVVNSESINIYRQLAGGVTAVNLLHGSANPIGGQNCVIKLRDGETPEGLKFANAPQGIKFALGENVKQANWGEKYSTRFPQTRMGVETFIANRFIAAQEYLADWAKFKKSGGLAPRRDLELEALGEILEGTRLIHCHSYRQDEILMLMRLMEGFHVRIGSLQHVLEGYKIADEIAKHGAGASTFSDWWAYKFEVYDAIPFNGSLMHERGVSVSFNSDSDELARRLYLEAAKAVKYGGTSETEAFKFVTLNPAEQLHIDKWVGSLEAGKDADFAIWSHSPLDSRTVCRQTWIDGKKYFDVALSDSRAKVLQAEYDALLAKAKKISGGDDGDEKTPGKKAKQKFFELSLEHIYDGVVRHCMEDEND